MRAVAMGLAVLLIVACGQGDGTPRATFRPTPPPLPTSASNLQLALDAARQRMEALQSDDWRPNPFILDWSDVESGMNLTATQNDAFCDALATPGLDDVLSTLVALGLDALSVRLRRAPLPDEADGVIDLAATFALDSCPTWLPVVNPPRPMPTPRPTWHPPGYSIVIGDPDLVWRWSAASTFSLRGRGRVMLAD